MDQGTFAGFAPSRFLIMFPSGVIARAEKIPEYIVEALQAGVVRVFDMDSMEEITPEGELEDISDIDDVDLEEEIDPDELEELLSEEE